jgi:hypothetical protein
VSVRKPLFPSPTSEIMSNYQHHNSWNRSHSGIIPPTEGFRIDQCGQHWLQSVLDHVQQGPRPPRQPANSQPSGNSSRVTGIVCEEYGVFIPFSDHPDLLVGGVLRCPLCDGRQSNRHLACTSDYVLRIRSNRPQRFYCDTVREFGPVPDGLGLNIGDSVNCLWCQPLHAVEES